jgi:hypothetical protein
MDTEVRFPTPTTRRTIVTTGAKLAYAAPLVAASLKLSATNAAAAVSLGSLCVAGSVLFLRVVLSDPEGVPFETAACCFCSFGDPDLPGAEAACRAQRPVQIDDVECPPAVVGDVPVECFAQCEAVP